MQWGLVLSGGGAKGAYQLGAWKALQETNMMDSIKAVSGASIGALNAAFFATENYQQAENAWNAINLLTVYDSTLDLIDGKEGTFSREGMLQLLDKYLDISKLTHSDMPIYCSITKLLNNKEQYVEYEMLNGKSEYAIKQILLATSALPIIHEPILYGDGIYRDGGLTDNFPIKPLYDLGYRNIIAIGLKKELASSIASFSDVNFITIFPSYHLGDLFTGTMNFTQKHIQFCKKLGYLDTKRILHEYKRIQNPNESPLSPLQMLELAQVDFQSIQQEFAFDTCDTRITEHKSSLNRILDNYDIEKME